MSKVLMRRIYGDARGHVEKRILVDRLWPRGISKERANLDYWLKEVGPSHTLRQWFGHDPDKFPAFKESYLKELASGVQFDAFEALRKIVSEADNDVVLLFASKEEKYNHVRILCELLREDGKVF